MTDTLIYPGQGRLTGSGRSWPGLSVAPRMHFSHGPVSSLTEECLLASPAIEMIHLEGWAPTWLQDMVSDVNRLATLGHDWDGYGAAPLSEKAARFGLELLVYVGFGGPSPRVSPTADGGLRMEWARSDIELVVEVAADGDVSVLFDDTGDLLEWDSDVLGDGRLVEALGRFAS